MSVAIGELEKDAIGEILNIAVGRAAASLSRMVRDQVALSVPFVDFLGPAEAAARLDASAGKGEAVAVRQSFAGAFDGSILLIFPEHRSLDLVRSLMGDTMSIDSLTELEQEALLEVGNVILNACLGSLVNQLGIAVESSLPTCLRGRGARLLDTRGDDNELVMFLQVDFTLAAKGIQGYLAFVMDILSARRFAEAVTAYVRRAMGG